MLDAKIQTLNQQPQLYSLVTRYESMADPFIYGYAGPFPTETERWAFCESQKGRDNLKERANGFLLGRDGDRLRWTDDEGDAAQWIHHTQRRVS